MKIPIGIFFGGATPARDQSYQTAQRVFQRLNRNDFDPIPVLVDPFGQLVLLDDLPSGESISEFYPSEKEQVPQQDVPFTFYPEQLGEVSETQKVALALSVGRVIDIAELPEIISIAFLALPDVEQLQLSLHEMRIPFTGEVAEFIHLCADRYRLLLEMQKCGFEMPACIRLTTKDWQDNNIQAIWGEDSVSVAYPLLLRPAYQYSTGRSSVVDAKDGPDGLRRAIDLAFGQKRLAQDDWLDMSPVDRENFVQHLAQWSSGVGFPLELWQKDEPMIFLDPTSLLAFLNQMPTSEKGQLVFRAQGNNDEILVSSLPEGTAVACVLIRNEDQQWDVADLRLLGNASRIVADLQKTGARPLKVADSMIEQIGTDCGKLAEELNAQTAVKIYGILDNSGRFIPEEVQAFTGPDKADNISASAIKSFIVASLQAGQIRHSDPIYRSLLAQLNSHSDIQPDVVSEAPYGYGP
ncbi:MAG: hypothetical protein KDD15_14035, partial [Lewinella sp.]|nr:hypothetical protein [Lewinella sp.]